MLTLCEGNFYNSAREEFKDEIARLVKEKKRCIFIVPEQHTVITEGEMARMLPNDAPLYFEVTNFTRFADMTFRLVGGFCKKGLGNAEKSLIMWGVLEHLKPTLRVFISKSEVNEGLVKKALNAVREFENIGIGAEGLLRLSNEKALDERLRDKLYDVSLITALYRERLEEKYADTKSILDKLYEKLIANENLFSDYTVFIDGFTSYTDMQYKIISCLIKRTNVNVGFTLPKLRADNFEYAEVRDTERKLIRCADMAGVKKRLLRLEGNKKSVNGELYEISKRLFKSSVDASDKAECQSDAVRIFESLDPYSECEFVADDIKRRVSEGESYRDFAICLRNADAYKGIIDASLENAGVPYFISGGSDISSFEAIKLIYTAYSIVEGGFSKGDVLSYAKCALSDASRDQCDEFEIYVNRWQINGRAFLSPFKMNPEGYTERFGDYTKEKLSRIENTRKVLIAPLVELSQKCAGKHTAKEHATILTEFLLAQRIDEKISASVKDANDERARLFKIICDCLDTVVECTESDMLMNAHTFINILKTVFANVSVGKIPSYYDTVSIESADTTRLENKKHIYIIGANYGVFPAKESDGGYFSDTEKDRLNFFESEIKSDKRQRGGRELYIFERAFAIGKESVTLTYPVRDTSFKAATRSECLTRISELSGAPIQKISDMPIIQRVYSKENAINLLPKAEEDEIKLIEEALIAVGMDGRIQAMKRPIENSDLKLLEDTARSLYGASLRLTQSRIDKFTDCPLKYFLSFVLKLEEDREARFDARNIGSFIHAILENFFKSVKEKKLGYELSEKEKSELIEKSAEEYLGCVLSEKSVKDVRTDMMVKRLKSAALPIIEGLCEEFKDCDFEPKFFELKIERGKGGSPSPVIFKDDHGEVYLYGTIDRVDTFKSGNDVYVRVVDYKTGSKDFKPEDLDLGQNLQMFIYLKSIIDTKNEEFKSDVGVTENGRLIPAGVIYVNTNIKESKIKSYDEDEEKDAFMKTQKRLGMMLDDPVSIGAMNANYIPVKFKKDGTADKRSQDLLYSEEGFKEIEKKLEKAVLKAAKGLRSGDIGAKPYITKDNPHVCEHCEYKAVCRKPVI